MVMKDYYYRFKLIFITILLGGLIFALAGCKGEKKSETDEAEKTSEASTEPVEKTEAVEGDYVAKVNGVPIIRKKVDQRMERTEKNAIRHKRPLSKDQRQRKRKAITDELIREELLKQYVAEQKVHITKENIDKRIDEEIQTKYKSKENLVEHLKRKGLTFENYQERIKFEMALEQVLLRHGSLTPDEEDLQKYYESSKRLYYTKEKAHIRLILVALPAKANEEETKEAEEKINNIYKLATKPDANFSKLAMEHSNDSSAENGGDIGFVTSRKLLPTMARVVFGSTTKNPKGKTPPKSKNPLEEKMQRLKTGEISKPFRTRKGYFIVKVEEREAAGIQPFEKVRPKLIPAVRRRKADDLKKRLAKKLEKDANIETNF